MEFVKWLWSMGYECCCKGRFMRRVGASESILRAANHSEEKVAYKGCAICVMHREVHWPQARVALSFTQLHRGLACCAARRRATGVAMQHFCSVSPWFSMGLSRAISSCISLWLGLSVCVPTFKTRLQMARADWGAAV